MSQRLGRGVAGGAVLIGAITILARIAGFAKQFAFAHTVGTNCLATAYFTANQVPNIVFEVVVGGALAGMVVPVLAGRDDAGRISSALMTWVLLVLTPLAVLVALLSGPIMDLFLAGQACGDWSGTAAHMLAVFAPQIPLYGMAVVLYGVLQSEKRFAGPAVAPLVSSIVVIVAYLLYLPFPDDAVLSVGTTLGVVAMVVTVLPPTGRLGLRWRPTLRFPDGVATRVRRLALAGIAGLLAQQAAMIVVLKLSSDIGVGAIAIYNYAWAIYLVPYAVLAVPIATSAFPRLSAAATAEEFAGLAARTTRAVVLVSGLAAGVLAAASGPGAVVFLGFKTQVPPEQLARAIALFAPGLVGYGLIAHLTRVLYAAGRGRAAASGTVAGWVVVMIAQTVFVLMFPNTWKIAGMALGMSVGMTAGGAWLLLAVRQARGKAALSGLPRAVAAAIAGGVAGYLAGAAVARWIDATGIWPNVLSTVAAALAALIAGAAVAAVLDRPDSRAIAGMVLRR